MDRWRNGWRMCAIVCIQVMVVQSKNISCCLEYRTDAVKKMCSFVACWTLIDDVRFVCWLCSPCVAAWQVVFALCGRLCSLCVAISHCDCESRHASIAASCQLSWPSLTFIVNRNGKAEEKEKERDRKRERERSTLSKHFIQALYQSTWHKHFIQAVY